MGVRVGTLEEEQASKKRRTDSQVMGRQGEGPDELQARQFVGVCGSRSTLLVLPCGGQHRCRHVLNVDCELLLVADKISNPVQRRGMSVNTPLVSVCLGRASDCTVWIQ